jgi:two-component system sensor histidine kinase BaeS
MTRRLVVMMVGLVMATLLIAGLGTLVLANARARTNTQRALRSQAARVATNVADLFDPTSGATLTPQQEQARLRQLTLLRKLLDLDGFSVLTASTDGSLSGDPLPAGVSIDRNRLTKLRAGAIVSGSNGNLVFAAASVQLPNGRLAIIVLSQNANAGVGSAARYFLLAAVATALLGLLAALVVGRRFTEPIHAVTSAAQRIAAGELSTRLPAPPADANDELADLARNVNTMAENLERSRTLEQQFLLSVSHDLRTPLTSIRGYAEAISDGAGDPARAAEVIRSESRRLERLVADLLDLAKLQASSFSLHPERLDLRELAIVSVQGFDPDAADRGLHILPPVPGPPILVDADHDRLGQVIANLIENALKYAAATIRVEVVVEPGRAVVAVHDDGPGIDPRDVEHVFERLYVARHQPRRAESSSGLGLAIVRQLVEAMGGHVDVRSTLGEGTTFVVAMPLRR